MRHIKLFEAFDNDDYYKEISKHEFVEIPILDISDRIISKIKALGLEIVKMKSPHILTSDGVRRVDIGYFIINDDIAEVVTIIECEDEYFIVQMDSNILFPGLSPETKIDYKCDQFEGLVKFLKDKGILK
jgi:hypothetical protein